MEVKLIFGLVFICLGYTRAQIDTTVCIGQIPGQNDPPLPPVLPDAFEVHVEANINNRNYTVDYHIWYNKTLNQISTHVTNAGNRFERLYRFDTNEMYYVDRNKGVCTVTPIPKGPYAFMVAVITGDQATMRSASAFLKFNDAGIKEKWISKTVVRGITCNMWRSCRYNSKTNSTVVVDWYFAAPEWTNPRINPQIPVRAHIHGSTVMKNNKKRAFDHTYEFSYLNLKSIGHLSNYQTPTGVYCPRAKNLKPLPTPAPAFHFTAEIIRGHTISRIKEWYDKDTGLVRYDYDPLGLQPYGSKALTQVHDFNTGVAYIVDTLRGNCTATPIGSTGFDVRNADPTHVRIRTSKEFFYFDKASYVYEGQRTVRGILCDVWIAQRNDWPHPGSKNSTWEWYFALTGYQSDQLILRFGNPVRMVLNAGLTSFLVESINTREGEEAMWNLNALPKEARIELGVTIEPGQLYTYNIYDYDEKVPFMWSYDISNCFNYTARQDFTFKLPGSYRNLVSGNMVLFRYAVWKAIMKAGTSNNVKLSSLRVFNVQIDYADNDDIIAQFTLLDKAPQVGDVENPIKENSLSVVSKSISGAIQTGQLIVNILVLNKGLTSIVAKPYSLTPGRLVQHSFYTQPGSVTSTGVSGGAMAGMGVALLVVFFAIGVAITYFYYRRQGGAFGPKKFDKMDITSSDT